MPIIDCCRANVVYDILAIRFFYVVMHTMAERTPI